MRSVLLLLFALSSFPLLAQDDGTAWRDALARAKQEKKPIVVFYRADPCPRCVEFERVSVPHPAIARRLPAVVFATLPAAEGALALFDRTGVLRARWPIIPDTTSFGIVLDSVSAVAGHLEEAARLIESGAPLAGEIEAAVAMQRLGHTVTARATLARVVAEGDPETRQRAIVALAVFDANAGRQASALAVLEDVVKNAASPRVAGEAATVIDAIHAAIQRAGRLGEAALPVIRVLPLRRQIVSGRQTVRTHVSTDLVARVTFSLDGREVRRVERPPFSAEIDFGAVPERHAVRVIAFDGKGREIGRDERVVNEGGETFRLRIEGPREGFAEGAVRVAMNLRAPAARRVQRVVVSWNDAERAVLTGSPWEAVVRIPPGHVGVLSAVAELDDRRTAEDAVLLNAGGAMGRADVQMVELPITVVGEGGASAPERIAVYEGGKVRRVESIATAAETPLTLGMLIDVSGSMQKTLPDLQEAAVRFLETALGPRDRAFVVAFDTRARLVQPPTADVALLRKGIMALRPEGLTALHDAMVLGLLQFEGIGGRRAMIVFSDGHDVTSRYEAEDVSELARRVNVPIHVISSLGASRPGWRRRWSRPIAN